MEVEEGYVGATPTKILKATPFTREPTTPICDWALINSIIMGLKSPTVTNAQNTQAPMAKHVVTVGHAWSQTSQRRSQMRKTPNKCVGSAASRGSVFTAPPDAIADVSKPMEMC